MEWDWCTLGLFILAVVVYFILTRHILMEYLTAGAFRGAFDDTNVPKDVPKETPKDAHKNAHKNTPARGCKTTYKDLKKYPRSKLESRIISTLEELTGKKFPTILPDWLCWKGKPLELDGYNHGLGLAIEVDGWWHHHWESDKEPYEKYFSRVINDIVKTRLCKRKGVCLIRVDGELPTRHVRNYLKSRLADCKIGWINMEDPSGFLDSVDYNPVQHTDSFRNEVLEKELGLMHEYAMANAL